MPQLRLRSGRLEASSAWPFHPRGHTHRAPARLRPRLPKPRRSRDTQPIKGGGPPPGLPGAARKAIAPRESRPAKTGTRERTPAARANRTHCAQSRSSSKGGGKGEDCPRIADTPGTNSQQPRGRFAVRPPPRQRAASSSRSSRPQTSSRQRGQTGQPAPASQALAFWACPLVPLAVTLAAALASVQSSALPSRAHARANRQLEQPRRQHRQRTAESADVWITERGPRPRALSETSAGAETE